jgi:hypothetical protein
MARLWIFAGGQPRRHNAFRRWHDHGNILPRAPHPQPRAGGMVCRAARPLALVLRPEFPWCFLDMPAALFITLAVLALLGGQWWRFALMASLAVLEYAARYRTSLLYNRYQAGRDQIARGTKDAPFAYVFPQEQRDQMMKPRGYCSGRAEGSGISSRWRRR